MSLGGAQTVPNTLLTFDGARYRLSDIQQADLIDSGEFERIGAATDADIDYEGELAVYSRAGDDGAVWTRMEAREGAEGEERPRCGTAGRPAKGGGIGAASGGEIGRRGFADPPPAVARRLRVAHPASQMRSVARLWMNVATLHPRSGSDAT
jgi:hypothetical protein